MNDGKHRATSKNHPVASTRKDKPQATKQADHGVQSLAKDVVRGVGQAGGALGKAAVQDVSNTPKYIKKRLVNTAGLPRTGGRPGLMGQDAPRGCGLFEGAFKTFGNHSLNVLEMSNQITSSKTTGMRCVQLLKLLFPNVDPDLQLWSSVCSAFVTVYATKPFKVNFCG